MVAIVDYGLSNLKSVAAAVEKVGFEAVITSDPDALKKADKLILPGVGAFGDGMRNLHERGLADVLHNIVVEDHKPILGICLGAQLMCRESFEFGHHQGLGWIDASVVRLEPGEDFRVPHVGWNALHHVRPCALFEEVPDQSLFYFVHSFHIRCRNNENIVGQCSYGVDFTAAVQCGHIFATQFHPEKSQLMGLKLLNNFLKMEKKDVIASAEGAKQTRPPKYGIASP